jgi:signal transduction histidine kinase
MNASEALHGGGRITVTTGTVVFGPKQTDLPVGHYGMIEVKDDGVGMTEQVRSRVFEPFFTTKPFGSSRGLGLSMVYGFAKQSNGQVVIDSHVGAGTTVRLFLPLSQTLASRPGSPQSAAS